MYLNCYLQEISWYLPYDNVNFENFLDKLSIDKEFLQLTDKIPKILLI